MATYTSPTTRTSGELITASIWNTDLVENLKYFKDSPTFDGNVVIGSGSTTRSFTVNGASSGAAGGASVLVQNGSTTYAAIGNKSAILGGAYDATGYVYGGTALELGTAGSTRLKIDGSGHVSINAAARLYMDGGSNNYIVQSGNFFYIVSNGSNVLQINTNGVYHYTMLTTASAANCYCADNSNLYRSTSSIRYKHDVETIDYRRAKEAVLGMRPVVYRGKTDEDQRRYLGFIAEEVAALEPLLATYDEGGETGTPNYVTYDRITAYLVAVVQDQQKQIDALIARAQW